MTNSILKALTLKKPKAILLEEYRYSDVDNIIFSFIKSINCSNYSTFSCEECIDCKKINKRSYFDMHIVNKNNEGILKERVVEILNLLSTTSLEAKGNKFLIIYQIEQANKFVINSLLKTIEEPPKNTYFIFITRNVQQVIPTIKSRCEIFKIAPNIDLIEKKLLDTNIDQNFHQDLINIYFNLNEMIENYNNGNFDIIKDLSIKIGNSNNNFPLQKELSNEFKKLDYNQITYLILLLTYKRENHIKQNVYSLIDLCKYNINKILIFNQLLKIIF